MNWWWVLKNNCALGEESNLFKSVQIQSSLSGTNLHDGTLIMSLASTELSGPCSQNLCHNNTICCKLNQLGFFAEM